MSSARRTKVSAGLLMVRRRAGGPEVLLVHPGGPFFKNKDLGGWSIPKGEVEAGEALEQAARREFGEEIGLPVPEKLLPLGQIKQKGGKLFHAWAFAGEAPDELTLPECTFQLEWPPRSGQIKSFPEVDQARFFDLAAAREKLNPAQVPLLDALARELGAL